MSLGLFITGTDTGVGKTYLAAAIVRRLRGTGYRIGAYKPAASGAVVGPAGPVWEDVEQLAAALGDEFSRERICPHRFLAPLAPPLAARQEGKRLTVGELREGANWWTGRVDLLIVEGAGGLLSPLAEEGSNADFAKELGFPLLVVARRSLGTINHTLLTLEAAEHRGLNVAGVILNDSQPVAADDISIESNQQELARQTSVPILASFPYDPQADLLQHPAFLRIDFQRLAAGRSSPGAAFPK